MINPKQGRSPESRSWHGSSFRSCWLPTHEGLAMNAAPLSALSRCSAIHTWAWQHNTTRFICRSPLSSILFSCAASSFVHISVAGLAKLKMNEAQRQTVVSTVTLYGKAAHRLVFFRESSKVTGSTCSCESQRERPEHLVHWLPTFKKKILMGSCLRATGDRIKNIRTLTFLPLLPL